MNDNYFTTIIIGAGPAGLMSAISAQQSGPNQSTLIIEKGNKAGRKLLITAAGQCNLTHQGSTEDILGHYNKKEKFLKPSLLNLTNSQLIDFFEERGVPLFFDDSGRCLPKSLNANDILRVLIDECRKRNMHFHFGDPVQSITQAFNESSKEFSLQTESAQFSVKTRERSFTSKQVIIATGGRSFPKTGSTGDGYLFAKSMGHSIITTKPALTGITVANFKLASLAGVSFENLSVDLYSQGKKKLRIIGDLLITHKGVSGPIIINNTRDMLEGDLLKINFTGISRESLTLNIKQTSQKDGKKTIGNYLRSYDIPKKLISNICPSIDTPLSQLKKEVRDKIILKLSEYPISVDQIQGFNTAMVTSGGVNTKEINQKTMESRLVSGLYFAGEVIDIDGDSGGYNLQAAFSTGNLAGNSLFKVKNR